MSPPYSVALRRARALLGFVVLVGALGLVTWFTCLPAGATWTRTAHVQTTPLRTPNSSVVVPPRASAEVSSDALIAQALGRLESAVDEGAAFGRLTVELEPGLATSLVARIIPGEPVVSPVGAPRSEASRSGRLERLQDGSLRVVDGWTTERGGRRFALRLAHVEGGAPTAEACVWDLDPADGARAWTGLTGTLAISRSSWVSSDPIVVRYHVAGAAGDGSPASQSGLIRFRVP